MKLSDGYYGHRNLQLKAKNSKSSRYCDATREMETFAKLHRLSFDNVFDFNNSNILDLGAGDRFLEDRVVELGSNYVPLDIDQVDFNCQRLPILDESQDLIITLAVIEHISDLDHFFSEIKRVIKPGGVVYITTPNFKYCYKNFYDDPTHKKPFTELSLKQSMEIYSFKYVSVYPGLRCKPARMYTRRRAFKRAASILFREKPFKLCPEWLYGRATSIIGIGKKSLDIDN